jgi:hypothetical protein
MLPGFRFLFGAVVLSMSILIFGLGAAALLRAAHEQFASMPARRAPAEQVFTKQNDPPMPPTLALLHFDPPVLDKPVENAPAAPDAAAAEPEKLAALPEEPMLTEAKPATPIAETTAAAPAAAVESEAPPPVADEEVKVAAVAATPEPSPAPDAAQPQPAMEVPSLEGNDAATRIATLGGPAVIIDAKAAANAEDAKPDRSVVRKRNAQRARERRRMIAARRARLARRAAATAALQQQQLTPAFGQPAVRATQ